MKIIKNRFFLAGICFILVVSMLVMYASYFTTSAEIITVYKLNTTASKGTKILDTMLTAVSVNRMGLDDLITDKKEIIGKFTTTDFLSGQLIMNSSILEDEGGKGLEQRLDGNKIAYSISVNSLEAGVSGKLMSNDIVSAYVHKDNASFLPPELTYLPILFVTTDEGTEKVGEETEIAAVTFLVTPYQAQLLNDYENQGKIHLALVYRGDMETMDKFISKQDEALKSLSKNKTINNTQKGEANGE